jgi:hypothetical protein
VLIVSTCADETRAAGLILRSAWKGNSAKFVSASNPKDTP